MKKLMFVLSATIALSPAMAQTYSARVSKDSVGVLMNRVDVLKANIKLIELKIDESKEEAEVEKLRFKMLEANGNAKSSAEQLNNLNNKTTGGSSVDLKAMDKLSKKAKSDTEDSQKALERYNKQITKVESIRTQIQGEERKLGYKKPNVIYVYK